MPVATPSVLLVFLGGGLGSVARYLIAAGLDRMRPTPDPADFPVATLAVNVTGCAVIGLLASWVAGRDAWRFGLMLGFLGGFTTFSSFALDAARLIAAGVPGKAIAYVLLSNGLGLGLAIAGFLLVGRGDPLPLPLE